MGYPDAAWERAMTVQEVMLKALSGELHWFRAADILGWSPRTLRRCVSGTRRMGMWGWSTSGCIGPRFVGWRPPRSSACCGCIASGTRGSMCGTFIKLSAESTASRCRTAS